jgi:hypothetical protein
LNKLFSGELDGVLQQFQQEAWAASEGISGLACPSRKAVPANLSPCSSAQGRIVEVLDR